MARASCVERIEAIEGINVYRWIVAEVGLSAGMAAGGPGGAVAGYQGVSKLFPDPVEYGKAIEGEPDLLERKTRKLGPDSAKSTLHELYELLDEELAVASSGLDAAWDGSASEAFTDTYVPGLRKHILDLADACEAQKKSGDKVKERIVRAHNEVVRTVERMVEKIVGMATLGTVSGAGGGASGGAWLAGPLGAAVGAAIGAASVKLAIINELIDYHNDLEDKLVSLNTDLGNALLDELRGLTRETLAAHVGQGEPSTSGWHPAAGR